MAHSLPAWRDPEGILALARLGVAEREGVRRADIAERLVRAGGRRRARRVLRHAADRHLELADPSPRGRGRPLRYLVPDAVAAYIEREGPLPPGTRLSLTDTA